MKSQVWEKICYPMMLVTVGFAVLYKTSFELFWTTFHFEYLNFFHFFYQVPAVLRADGACPWFLSVITFCSRMIEREIEPYSLIWHIWVWLLCSCKHWGLFFPSHRISSGSQSDHKDEVSVSPYVMEHKVLKGARVNTTNYLSFPCICHYLIIHTC